MKAIMGSSSKFVTDLRRNLKNSEFAARLFGIWAVLAVVLFGFYGIRPLFQVIKQKQATLEKIREININLERNTLHLKEIQDDLHDNKGSLVYLEKFMPLRFEVQNYMLDFIDTASKSGFIVKTFKPSTNPQGDEMDLSVSLTGSGDIREFVHQMEQMKRVTQINKVHYNVDERGTHERRLSVSFSIYKLGE